MSDSEDSGLTMTDLPDLEVPPSPEAPNGMVGDIFSDETIAPIVAKFTVLESLMRLLIRNYKFQEFTRELLLVIMKAVKSEAGSILEVDHSKNCLFFRAAVGQSSDTLGNFTVPLGQGIAGYVAESRQPLCVVNADDHKLHMKSIPNAVGFSTRNLVAVPIIVRGKIYGVLELVNKIGENGFSAADVELLTYLCEMAAKAIEIRMMIAWSAKREAA